MNTKNAIRATSLLAAFVLAGAALGQGKTMMDKGMSRYGGPVYTGAPALTVTASLVEAGGGTDWSFVKAVTSMAGEKTANAEVAKLTKQYGKTRVTRFVTVFDFAVADALKIATAAGVKLPEGNLSGAKLASTLVTAGQDKSGVFYTEFLLDKALTHDIHMQVMADIDKKFGESADKDYHRISNQAHYDLGKALGVKVKLAKLH